MTDVYSPSLSCGIYGTFLYNIPRPIWCTYILFEFTIVSPAPHIKLSDDEKKIREKMNELLKNKTQADLKRESSSGFDDYDVKMSNENDTNEQGHRCHEKMTIDELKMECCSFKRIKQVLTAYHLLKETMDQVKILDIIQTRDLYDHQQLYDDFMHLKVIHIDADNDKIRSHDHWEIKEEREQHEDIGKQICEYFET
eukprot:539544_1